MADEDKKRRFISRSGISEELQVEYDCGEDTDYRAGFETDWREWKALSGSFVGFDKLDPKWHWVFQKDVLIAVEGKAYVLAAIGADGRFKLQPRRRTEGN